MVDRVDVVPWELSSTHSFLLLLSEAIFRCFFRYLDIFLSPSAGLETQNGSSSDMVFVQQ